jgi:poly(3-hydroxybutyrate) depolymerase
LESAHIAWPDDLEDIQNAANTSGVAVALTDGRGNIGDAPIGEADEFEVLNDVNSNYSIDRQRLYLYGTCEGGRRALLLAEHYPGLFAAIGVYGPARRK